MARVISIEKCFAMFTDTFSPKVVGELNGQHVKLVRLEGDKVPWHAHEREDELFWVLEGVLEVHERDGVVVLHPGEFCIVARGREHKVVPRGHVKLVLFEPAGIAHTGDVRAEITRKTFDRLIPGAIANGRRRRAGAVLRWRPPCCGSGGRTPRYERHP